MQKSAMLIPMIIGTILAGTHLAAARSLSAGPQEGVQAVKVKCHTSPSHTKLCQKIKKVCARIHKHNPNHGCGCSSDGTTCTTGFHKEGEFKSLKLK